MTKFINHTTGAEMWVADNRVDEYLAAGHKLAAGSGEATESTGVKEETENKEETAKKPVKASPKRKR